MTVGAHEVQISNPDKELFPGITKTHVLGYYLKVAPRMLPHLDDRPLSLVRHPDGVTRPGFYQKTPQDHFPAWMGHTTLPRRSVPDDTRTYSTVTTVAELAYLAGQAAIELHGWGSRASDPRRPDRLVIDLDPAEPDPEAAWPVVKDTTRRVLTVLDALQAPTRLLVTGSRGIHVLVPLEPEAGFDQVRACADRVARVLIRDEPKAYTQALKKEARGDRLFLDTLRNVYGATAVMPWSLRARRRAPIATPVDRGFLDRADARADRFTIHDVLDLTDRPDPWDDGMDPVPVSRLMARADDLGLP